MAAVARFPIVMRLDVRDNGLGDDAAVVLLHVLRQQVRRATMLRGREHLLVICIEAVQWEGNDGAMEPDVEEQVNKLLSWLAVANYRVSAASAAATQSQGKVRAAPAAASRQPLTSRCPRSLFSASRAPRSLSAPPRARNGASRTFGGR